MSYRVLLLILLLDSFSLSWSFSTQLQGTQNSEIYTTMLEVADSTKLVFQGRSVLVTGASGGLGAQLAIQLAQCKVQSLVLSARKEEALQKLVEECKGVSPETTISFVKCDLSNRESVLNLGKEALVLCDGVIDILINCGGVSSRSNFVDSKLEIDEMVMQINFLSGAALAKAVVPNMILNKFGKIIWISSVQGLVGIPSRTSYAASKFAVQGYCEALRAELATSGITVHCVSPGYIKTNLSKSAMTGDGTAHGKMDATTAQGADPKDVAVEILDSVAKGKNDFIVAANLSAKAAIWARLLCPGLLQKMLVKRFLKSEQKEKED
jgi:dehydrogenase/reductase SDR family protein 7B